MRAALAAVILWAGVTVAQAHAFLDHAEPKVGATVNDSPAKVTVWFTEEVKPASTAIAVFNPKGEEIDLKDSKVAGSDRAQMSVSLPPLAPGDYKVVWKATCKLGHHTTGDFTFRVAGSR